MKKLCLFVLILTGCQTLEGTLIEQDNIKTIGFCTGSMLDDTSLNYGSKFVEEAKEKCEGSFELKYSGREPWTIAPALRKSHYTYWIIECTGK